MVREVLVLLFDVYPLPTKLMFGEQGHGLEAGPFFPSELRCNHMQRSGQRSSNNSEHSFVQLGAGEESRRERGLHERGQQTLNRGCQEDPDSTVIGKSIKEELKR